MNLKKILVWGAVIVLVIVAFRVLRGRGVSA